MNANPMPFRVLPKYAAMFESEPVVAQPRWQPAFGFGSKVASKSYSPPQEKALPADFLRKPKEK